MEKRYETTREGKHIVPLILPYQFSNVANESLTYQEVEPNSFYEILEKIPPDTEIYFNMLSRRSTWWGTGKDNLTELYETLIENPLLLSINAQLHFRDIVAAQKHGVNENNKTGVSQEVVLGVSYQNSNGGYTAIVTVFGINANEFQQDSVEFSGVHTRTDIINNIDHTDISTSTVREFGNSGPYESGVVKDPVSHYEDEFIPITEEFADISAPLLGTTTDSLSVIKYEMSTIISTPTVLYDCSITTAEAVSEKI